MIVSNRKRMFGKSHRSCEVANGDDRVSSVHCPRGTAQRVFNNLPYI
jgi:hypothetical protein